MEYIGEFLSTKNTISEDEDRIIKYFYYRPSKYDDPAADYENVFDLRALTGELIVDPNWEPPAIQGLGDETPTPDYIIAPSSHPFPQVGDKLAENDNYEIESITVEKRVDDDNTGVKKISYIATCNYDTAANIAKRKSGSGGGSAKPHEGEDIGKIADEDGKEITTSTPPWKYLATVSYQPQAVEVPLLYSYNTLNQKQYDIFNSAGERIIATTTRYRIEYTYKMNSKTRIPSLTTIIRPQLNLSTWTPSGSIASALLVYNAPSATMLMMPPSVDLNYWKVPNDDIVSGYNKNDLCPYYTYTIKFIYDPETWIKSMLDVGTYAKFNGQPAEQIYSYRIKSGTWGNLQFGNIAAVSQAQASVGSQNVSYEKVTEPLPLNSDGSIRMVSITDPVNNPYLRINRWEFPFRDFNTLPLK